VMRDNRSNRPSRWAGVAADAQYSGVGEARPCGFGAPPFT